MILTDYFRSEKDLTWEIGKQCGVDHGVIRLPETEDFDLTDAAHWRTVVKRFTDFGIKPLIVEPMPNAIHDHIKAGDRKRDESIEKAIKMLPIMEELGIKTICFNFMAHVGWTRTNSRFPERGGACVTEFDLNEFVPVNAKITEKQLWENYTYFLKALVPEAEKHGILLALHPDDPPLPRLGDVERIFVTPENVHKGVFEILPSPNLGVTFCQANFYLMGADIKQLAKDWAEKIFFVHFRNTTGVPEHFRETFHDNGEIDMADVMRAYVEAGINVPVRVDHVPTLAGEASSLPGYDALGRMFAIGYLKGILDAVDR